MSITILVTPNSLFRNKGIRQLERQFNAKAISINGRAIRPYARLRTGDKLFLRA
jgi:hypothetical protein